MTLLLMMITEIGFLWWVYNFILVSAFFNNGISASKIASEKKEYIMGGSPYTSAHTYSNVPIDLSSWVIYTGTTSFSLSCDDICEKLNMNNCDSNQVIALYNTLNTFSGSASRKNYMKLNFFPTISSTIFPCSEATMTEDRSPPFGPPSYDPSAGCTYSFDSSQSNPSLVQYCLKPINFENPTNTTAITCPCSGNSQYPSQTPSSPTTASPTYAPSILPTSTQQPTSSPTNTYTSTSPSNLPSMQPTCTPTLQPNLATSVPTLQPSLSTDAPTLQPNLSTDAPTLQPTVSSAVPTLHPSLFSCPGAQPLCSSDQTCTSITIPILQELGGIDQQAFTTNSGAFSCAVAHFVNLSSSAVTIDAIQSPSPTSSPSERRRRLSAADATTIVSYSLAFDIEPLGFPSGESGAKQIYQTIKSSLSTAIADGSFALLLRQMSTSFPIPGSSDTIHFDPFIWSYVYLNNIGLESATTKNNVLMTTLIATFLVSFVLVILCVYRCRLQKTSQMLKDKEIQNIYQLDSKLGIIPEEGIQIDWGITSHEIEKTNRVGIESIMRKYRHQIIRRIFGRNDEGLIRGNPEDWGINTKEKEKAMIEMADSMNLEDRFNQKKNKIRKSDLFVL